MKRNVSVVCVCSAPNILISGKIIKEMPGSVASGTHYGLALVFFACVFYYTTSLHNFYTTFLLCSCIDMFVLHAGR